MSKKTVADNNYVVATIRPWNIEQYKKELPTLPGNWQLITESDQLTKAKLDALKPRYVFFPHWSHKVPDDILEAYECVCFHMTDVPYGRGGSPLQNLIIRGETETVVTALRMTNEMDAGPVYYKRKLSLHGRAEEIYKRASVISFEMIRDIIAKQPVPTPQTGKPVMFTRRTPKDSLIPKNIKALDKIFDIIRMLDAEGYPPAYIEHGNVRLEFSRAELKTDEIAACVTIKLIKGAENES